MNNTSYYSVCLKLHREQQGTLINKRDNTVLLNYSEYRENTDK